MAIVEKLFYAFKALQAMVFLNWCFVLGDGSLALTVDPLALGVGGAAIIVGQLLNWSVFYRLGRVGVFFGDRLGHPTPRCAGLPFTLLSHPQYVGTVLTIWGLFLATRFPQGDWFLIPALETAYYVVGAHLETRKRDGLAWARVTAGSPDGAR